MLKNEFLKISEAADLLGVEIQTLRNWEKEGKLKPDFVTPGRHRLYRPETILSFSKDLFGVALNWVRNEMGQIPVSEIYCENSAVFQSRLLVLNNQLLRIGEADDLVSSVITIVGEIGNNSFDHNIGDWPDVLGIVFIYDLNRRVIVIADRGRGIRRTLSRVKPDLVDDRQALTAAFTEFISGRAPEQRGNGLKLVHALVTTNPLALYYQSGDACLRLDGISHKNISPEMADVAISGTIARLEY